MTISAQVLSTMDVATNVGETDVLWIVLMIYIIKIIPTNALGPCGKQFMRQDLYSAKQTDEYIIQGLPWLNRRPQNAGII